MKKMNTSYTVSKLDFNQKTYAIWKNNFKNLFVFKICIIFVNELT